MGMHLFSQVIGFSEDKREQMRRTISEMPLGGARKARPPPPPGRLPASLLCDRPLLQRPLPS